jgi:hypothetical protein
MIALDLLAVCGIRLLRHEFNGEIDVLQLLSTSLS